VGDIIHGFVDRRNAQLESPKPQPEYVQGAHWFGVRIRPDAWPTVAVVSTPGSTIRITQLFGHETVEVDPPA
jgi:hypothetical protein